VNSLQTSTHAGAARMAISSLLDGHGAITIEAEALGPYWEAYTEIRLAYAAGGKGAARRMFVTYAEHDPAMAALMAADPAVYTKVWSTAELLAATFPEPKWAVPGLLPVGLDVLAGRPKLGKSWLALQVAVAVGTGGTVLGTDVEQGRVLYLALEDNARRLQNRLRLQCTPAHADVTWRTSWEPLTERGTADLIGAINSERYTLVIIDTISRALGRADQMDQADMNVTIGTLQRIALETNIALLLVDHHRKNGGSAGDVIDDVMGATSKVGVADAVMGMYRERGQTGATLKVTGRDVEEQELGINWDAERSCWQLSGTAAGVKSDSLQAEILEELDELGGEATAADLAKRINRDRSNVRKELLELVAKGAVARCEKVGREVHYQKV
jgi:hypothetical protein